MAQFRSAFLVLACILIGCSSSTSPFDYVPTTGQVTYEDGTAIPSGGFELKFYAVDVKPVNGAKPRPATAGVNGQGEFSSVTSYKHGDGLIPGKHRVAFFYATDDKGKLLVPEEYTKPGSSPLIVEATGGPLEIKVPKP